MQNVYCFLQFIEPELRESINSEMKFISKLPKAMALLLRMLQMNNAETDEMQTYPSKLLNNQRKFCVQNAINVTIFNCSHFRYDANIARIFIVGPFVQK